MAYIIDEDSTTIRFLMGVGQKWILTQESSSYSDATAFDLYGSDNKVTFNGYVEQQGDSQSSTVYIEMDDSTIRIGKTATIRGHDPIYNDSNNVEIINAGTLISTSMWGAIRNNAGQDVTITNLGTAIATNGFGIYSGGNGEVEITNAGYVTGTSGGIFLASASGRLVNEANGTIVAKTSTLINYVADGTTINHGTIRAASGYAVYLSGGNEKLVNDGRISGDVYLGAGNDVFDNRGGLLDGSIYGSYGDDTLIVDKANYLLFEYADGGSMDTVKSTVSYTLSDYVENLVLLGKNNIGGTGSAQANTITGNSGNNRLAGMGGSDTFVFGTKSGRDTIADYDAVGDTIDISSWHAFKTIDQVEQHAKNHDGDLWLASGKDTLIVKGYGVDFDDVNFIL